MYEDQDRLLDEASAVVKEQAFYMKRAIDSDNLRDALKHASNLVCELRTSLLSPRNYYDLYMKVFQELQHLSSFFSEQKRHGKKMGDLYESVQHAANILPRLYLLVTVGGAYVKSKEAAAGEILRDVSELCKGVQHPVRGLFLRYFLSQMMKDKLPDTGSEYEECGGGNINDAFEFVLNNFMESNRLWCRIQMQGSAKDKSRREKERHDLRVVVGANLVRLSQLDGLTYEFYKDTALPKLIEQLLATKDVMAQQYLLDCIIQVFPDEYHLNTLDTLLDAMTKVQAAVDLKQVACTLMRRLANYVKSNPDLEAVKVTDVFGMFRQNIGEILERGGQDLQTLLELQVAFMNFTLSLYPTRLDHVATILSGTVNLLLKSLGYDTDNPSKLGGGDQVSPVVELMNEPVAVHKLAVFELEQYSQVMQLLTNEAQKEVALAVGESIVRHNLTLVDEDEVRGVFNFLAPLCLEDDSQASMRSNPGSGAFGEEDGKQNSGDDILNEDFVFENELTCSILFQIRNESPDVLFRLLSLARGFFGKGGEKRMRITLPALLNRLYDMIPYVHPIEANAGCVDAESGGTIVAPEQGTKKYFQFAHKTLSSALNHSAGEVAVGLWLKGAHLANDLGADDEGYAAITVEFVEQALIVFEEEIQDNRGQYRCINLLVSCLSNLGCLDEDTYNSFAAKVTQHAIKLLKKPQQCRGVNICSRLFWNPTRQQGEKVAECLQRCLKIAEAAVQGNGSQVILFIETLDNYVYYWEHGCGDVKGVQINTLIQICMEHCREFRNEEAIEYLKQILIYLRGKRGGKWDELDRSLLEF